jgi:predicted ribosome-associated RNA-binding protein Tma20
MKDIRRNMIESICVSGRRFEIILPKKSAMTSIESKSGKDEEKVEIILVDNEVVCAILDHLLVPILRIIP